MNRDIAANVIALATPLILAILGAFFGAMATAVNRWSRARGYDLNLSVLERGAVGVAADFAQHVVADLKDPSKPGTWDTIAARAVRDDAVSRLARLYPKQFQSVAAQIGSPAARELIGTLVERAVVAMKASPRTAALGAGVEVALPRPQVPAPIAPASSIGARAADDR